MREVLDLARRAGTSRCPVLVVGERGTGHEMVARTIHASSGGAAGGFVKFACGSLNDRELHQVLDGPFEQTVFFDDIGELPVEMQNHVTRQLADWMTGPRILAGALPGLPDAVERREVRRELVDALSVLRINLLPLRERREDIPLLAMRFLKEACLTGRVPAKTFSRPALTVLGAMPWPGNALQLGSLCERLAVAVPRGTILLEDLLHNVRLEAAVPLNLPREPLRTARERFEREYIVSTLQEHRGRMGPAARQLGIERTNLYRKMKQLRIRGSNPDV
jgi:DNA-binding NtrC family response regulator